MEKQLIIDNIDRIPEGDREIIETMIRDYGIQPKYYIKTDFDILIEAVQTVFCVTLNEMKSDSRKGNLPYARRVVFYYAKKIFPKKVTDQQIGALLNKRQPAVHAAIKVFKRENSPLTNPQFYEYVLQIKEVLKEYRFIKD
jgi:chromosomal replication initiation ATPase DnaA